MMPGDPNFTPDPTDERLRGLFSILRREDEARTPPFLAESKLRREQCTAPRIRWRLAGASVFVATILAALFWLRPGSSGVPAKLGQGSNVSTVSITEWRPPTDFLLNTPGREILRTAPVRGVQLYPHPTGSTPNHKPKSRAPAPLSQ